MEHNVKQRLSTEKFDVLLDTDVCDAYNNADLTIQLRLGFRPINPAGNVAEGTYHDYGDATAPNRKIIRWTPASWARWTQNMVSTAQAYWDGKFWLVNNFAELEKEIRGVKYRPNIYGRCQITATTIDPNVYGPYDDASYY
jgi:hypothetical protein